MNNNRSHEYENYMNSYGMQEIRNEAKKARMLKDAGLSGPNVLTGIVVALGKLLVRRKQRIQDRASSEHELSIQKR
ncbi:MAG TPA: hypothetical protein VKE92_14375 [Anaerolineales bacterium]|nr:hypothetical protein [Anaerolineales bacterium]